MAVIRQLPDRIQLAQASLRSAESILLFIKFCSAVAQWQSRWLLTTWLLVRIQPAEPFFGLLSGSCRIESNPRSHFSGCYPAAAGSNPSIYFPPMTFHVYVLYSSTCDRLYIGQTNDINSRLLQHRTGNSRYTKRAMDWQLIYQEEQSSRHDARMREAELKSHRGRTFLRNLIAKR